MAKGQAEIAVILGIVIVAAVVIIYALGPNIIPTPQPTGKYGMVKASVEGLVLDGAQDTMRGLSANGGYLDSSSYQLGSVEFLGKEIPYWQYNGQVKTPDMKENFIRGLEGYLSANKGSMLQAMKVSGVELGEPRVSANFLPSKIQITVNMPTEVDGRKISTPYVVEVQTRFSEIEEFSKGFAQQDAQKRYLEYYTISSVIMSPIEEDIHAVPTFIFLTECGEYVFIGWWDIKPEMEYAIKATLANTYMPGKVPLNTMMTSTAPKYTLVPINGKRYEGLDVSFQLPDSFELTPANFQFSPDPIVAISKVIPLVGECQSDPVLVNYFVSYPAIARIKDPLTQNVFQFAVHVYIKDNQPGQWASVSGYEGGLQNQICSNPQCAADITVKDSSGRPVDYASVSFMGCDLGRTDSKGGLKAAAPCGLGPLQVYRQGYDSFSRMESSDTIRGISLTLARTPAVTLHFYEVIVQNLSLAGRYDISKDGVRVMGDEQFAYINFHDIANGKAYQMGYKSKGGRLSMLPAGSYMVTASLMQKTTELGAFVEGYALSEDLDGKDLHIYLPSALDYGLIADNAGKAGAAVTLTNVLSKCGLGPISSSEVKNFVGCSVRYNEV